MSCTEGFDRTSTHTNYCSRTAHDHGDPHYLGNLESHSNLLPRSRSRTRPLRSNPKARKKESTHYSRTIKMQSQHPGGHQPHTFDFPFTQGLPLGKKATPTVSPTSSTQVKCKILKGTDHLTRTPSQTYFSTFVTILSSPNDCLSLVFHLSDLPWVRKAQP
jgi:hypothetical protein